MRKQPLTVGEPAPWFATRSSCNPSATFSFDLLAGRYVVLCFFHSAGDMSSRCVLDDIIQHQNIFDGANVCFFGISADPDDEQLERVHEMAPGIHFFWDFNKDVSRAFGAVIKTDNTENYLRHTLVLDERLRTLAVFPFHDDATSHVPELISYISRLPCLGECGSAAAHAHAPILIVPRVFDPELCRTLIQYYEDRGGKETGFMQKVDGKTTLVYDYRNKRRSDIEIMDKRLRDTCLGCISARLIPEIYKAFQFRATHIERYVIGCYYAELQGHFLPHRDNTAKGVDHRQFAVSINLNTGQYKDGDLRFPEFGRQTYTAPLGGAIVFSCSLLHEATLITQGRRYVFLPFLYDDEAAKIRKESARFLAGNV